MECNIESYLNIKNTIYLQVGYNFFSSTNHKWSHDIIIIPPASDGWSLGHLVIEIVCARNRRPFDDTIRRLYIGHTFAASE